MAKILLPDAPGVVRIVHKGVHQNQPWVNTFHVRGSLGVYVQADMEAVASAMHTAYFNAFIPQFNTQTSLLTTTAIDLSSRQGYFGVEDAVHPGTIVANSLPALQIAYCVSWIITDRYRGGHPRMYLCAGQMSEITNGRQIGATKLSALQAAATGYLVSAENMTVAGQTWDPVCVRYFSQGVLLNPPSQRKIEGSAVHTRVDTMRRRLGKEAS